MRGIVVLGDVIVTSDYAPTYMGHTYGYDSEANSSSLGASRGKNLRMRERLRLYVTVTWIGTSMSIG